MSELRPPVGGCEKLSDSGEGGGGLDADHGGGSLVNVEQLSDDGRREIAGKLTSAGCEMALALVYSDGSTQLREISGDAKVHSTEKSQSNLGRATSPPLTQRMDSSAACAIQYTPSGQTDRLTDRQIGLATTLFQHSRTPVCIDYRDAAVESYTLIATF